jgi:hypothetical protein
MLISLGPRCVVQLKKIEAQILRATLVWPYLKPYFEDSWAKNCNTLGVTL